MSVGTADYTIKNLNEKTNDEIEGFLKKSKEELFNLRFQNATGQLDNSARLKAVKRDVARMYTVLRERELGISQAPEASEIKTEEK
ncbi:MAG: 50S ribosomal protein L29 [Bifidobacterium tibiigranuli]|jgi:large subunit ribosomal protein L29|uniref:50S ribosomal protein L29 n=1 Tax=Bifidobacterium tibiigranuli TaxID=2172043 RepID=UPI00235610BD|nr:50S ribosomal protein L29 [Bifidobacterium tibiigranuli]MCH3975322.1 50S ribosomal protein L29 [Bifidobacterium tibiigranuli]MCH4203521.1 50S ribosomal protein L29 [Bifidobacterium tibiigranuli]MCH4273867.1 50S ribosomal protein L29 [Bifidobacterium tibiigranuli]